MVVSSDTRNTAMLATQKVGQTDFGRGAEWAAAAAGSAVRGGLAITAGPAMAAGLPFTTVLAMAP